MKKIIVFARFLASPNRVRDFAPLVFGLVLAFSFCKKMETPAPPPDPIDPPDPVSICAGKLEMPELLGWRRDSFEIPFTSSFGIFGEKLAFLNTLGGDYQRSIDGGKTWQAVVGLESILEMDFPDSLHGFAAWQADDLSKTFFFQSTDGGLNWSKKELLGEWTSFYFLNEKAGFAIQTLPGQLATLQRTDDGGQTWLKVVGAPGRIRSKNRDRQILIGRSSDEYFKSDDFGLSWQKIVNPIPDPSGESETSFEFFDAQNGIAFLLEKEQTTNVHETNDGGKTWHRIDGGRKIMDAEYLGSGRLLALEFLEDGWPTVCGRWIETTDGGQSWSSSPIWAINADGQPEQILAFGPNRIFYNDFSKIVENGSKRRFYWLARN